MLSVYARRLSGARVGGLRALSTLPAPNLDATSAEAKIAASAALGFKDASVLCYGTGAVTNTLLALMNQVTGKLSLFSNHAEHVTSSGIELHHRGGVYGVPAGGVSVFSEMSDVSASGPEIVINGRQVGGDYDQIFDACGPETRYIVTAQNGQSSQALYRASVDYIARNPAKADIIQNIVGLDAAMFVKMSGTGDKSKTILQPGAKWLFGAFDMKDGSGTGVGGTLEVNDDVLAKADNFVNWFRLLDADDGVNEEDVKLNSQAVSGKLVKTANNIGGNYGTAVITRVVQNMNAKLFNGPPFTAPLPYGVLHESYDVEGKLAGTVGAENVTTLQQEVRKVREMSLQAVGEYYNLNEPHFEAAGFTQAKVMEAAQMYWTELDKTGDRIPSLHPPTHALAIYERRPSEPLLDDIISSFGEDMTPKLRELRDYHRFVEQEVPLPYVMKQTAPHWLSTAVAKGVVKKAETQGVVDVIDLVSIKSYHYAKPKPSSYFKAALADMGEHAISYMERLGEFKGFYESLPGESKPRFINLTIGGVYRDTPPRTDVNASRGYVTHLTPKDKDIVANVFNRLGVDLTVDQVAVSPLRSKVAIQHAMGLFQKGVVVAHTPNYKATIDSAKNEHGHTIVEVDVRGRYSALFAEARRQAELPQHKKTPIILLLVCPQNPCAIAMTDDEEEELHQLIADTNVHVIHDIAYQGYTEKPRDAGKRYRDHGMPHDGQVYMAMLSTSKSMYASGQPALYTADKHFLPFLMNHYQRVATGPTSTFVHDLKYYYDTLDDTYMRSVEDKLQKPMLDYIDANKDRWGVDYLVRPDGPPFITLDIKDKLKELGLKSKGFRELTLRMGSPVLVNEGVLRIALTGFDKSMHDTMLPEMLERLDDMLSIKADDAVVTKFLEANPFYGGSD